MYTELLQHAELGKKLKEKGIITAEYNVYSGDIDIHVSNIDLFDSLVQNREIKYVHYTGDINKYEVNFKQYRYGRVFNFFTLLTEQEYLEHKKSHSNEQLK